MTREHVLSSDETVVVFRTAAAESLFERLSKRRKLQRQFLGRVRDALESEVPAQFVEKPYRGVDHVEQFRAGDEMRGYCVYAEEPPSYNVFYMLEVTAHNYDAYPVAKYDRVAERVTEKLRSLSSVAETEAFLNDHDAMGTDDVERLLDQL
jgi:alpha-ketoglutarate-dependent taurine dioxygenase